MKKLLLIPLILLPNIALASKGEMGTFIKKKMEQYNVPGASIAVIKDFKIEWAKGYGVRDKKTNTPVNTKTIFQAASISKPITAVAVMDAFRSKRLSLDENINKMLTSWKIPKSDFTKSKPVTMKLLLSHTSGVTGFRYKGYTTKDKLPTLLQSLKGEKPANTEPVVMVRKPDTKFEYSPAGYTIIQQALVDIYQKPFADVMSLLILNPLKMIHSTFDEPLPRAYFDNLAMPYLPDGKLMPNSPLIFPESAAGGMWSTPSDIAKFVIAVEKTLAGRPQFDFDEIPMKKMLTPQLDHHMGLGFEVNINQFGEPVDGEGNYFRHGGFNSGYLSMFVGSKKYGNGVVVMINAGPYMDATDIPQYDFLADVIKQIAIDEEWHA